MPRRLWGMDKANRPLLLGHRGVPSEARENTLTAFQLAFEQLDGIELDVQRSQDGQLVIYHDFDLEGQPIHQLDWAELHHRAPQIPRLEEVLELHQNYSDRWINAELKSLPPASDGREADLVRVLNKYPLKAQIWVSSFDPLALIRLAKEGLHCPMALLYNQPELLELAPCLPIAGVHPHHSQLDARRVSQFKDRGWFVNVWTVNQPELAQQLLAWGVDGLIGDYPQVLKTAAGR